MKIPIGAHKQCDKCKRIHAQTISTRFDNGTHYLTVLTYVNCTKEEEAEFSSEEEEEEEEEESTPSSGSV